MSYFIDSLDAGRGDKTCHTPLGQYLMDAEMDSVTILMKINIFLKHKFMSVM